METRVLEALSVVDVEGPQQSIRITYQYDTPGMLGQQKIDWVYTRPRGDWTRINFNDPKISLEEFLYTMCDRNTETLKKIATTILKKIDDRQDLYRYSYLGEIIDPTFRLPPVNPKSRWQKEFAENFVKQFLPAVILTATNYRNLDNLVKELLHIVHH